jgi:uncharacterized DUF497 family protein
MDFRWNDWNEEHVGKHGVSIEEAERVVENARSPFPRMIEDDKRLVWGRGRGGRLLQVIFFSFLMKTPLPMSFTRGR